MQKPTWCQEWVQRSNRLWWLRHQRIQVHQGSIGAQEGLWGFPGRALFAWCPTRVLGFKEIRTRGTAVLRWQSGTWFSCNTKGHTKLLVNAQSQAQRSLKCVRAEVLCAKFVLVCSVFEAVTPSQHASRSVFFSRAWRSYSQSCSALLMEFPQLCCSRWDSQAPRNRFSKALALHHCCALPSWIPPRVFFSKSSAVLQAEPSWEHSTHRVWQFAFTDHWPEEKYIKSIHRRYFLIFLLEFTHLRDSVSMVLVESLSISPAPNVLDIGN